MFEVLTPANSARITMNDNLGRSPPETWIIGREAASVAWALLAYARKHKIRASQVGYSVVYEEGEKREDQRNTRQRQGHGRGRTGGRAAR